MLPKHAFCLFVRADLKNDPNLLKTLTEISFVILYYLDYMYFIIILNPNKTNITSYSCE